VAGFLLCSACAEVVWAVRRPGAPYAVQEADPLPQREALYRLGNSLAAGNGEATQGFAAFRHLPGAEVVEVRKQVGPAPMYLAVDPPLQGDGLFVRLTVADGPEEELEVDNVLAMVGYRPDTSITSELQVQQWRSTMPRGPRFTTASPQRAR
jgi:hypothetical protein